MRFSKIEIAWDIQAKIQGVYYTYFICWQQNQMTGSSDPGKLVNDKQSDCMNKALGRAQQLSLSRIQ